MNRRLLIALLAVLAPGLSSVPLSDPAAAMTPNRRSATAGNF